jgi:hypothetical protein
MANKQISNLFQFSPLAIASYQGIDIATGKGFAIYYLADTIKGEKVLTTETIYSSTGTLRNTSAIDLDFDITIERSLTIGGGDFLASICCGDVSGANPHSPTLTVTLEKVSGGTTTTIGTDNSTVSLSATDKFKIATFKISNDRTTFKAGDILRLRVQMTKRGSVYTEASILFDPSNTKSTSTFPIWSSQIKIPIRIDL